MNNNSYYLQQYKMWALIKNMGFVATLYYTQLHTRKAEVIMHGYTLKDTLYKGSRFIICVGRCQCTCIYKTNEKKT